MYAWQMDDEGWLAQLQERIGKCVGKCHGGHVALPELRVVAAAVELCLTSQYDVDFAALRAKFAIDVSWGHLKEVAEKIKRLGLLEVEPAELSRTAPAYDAALLASLQLRLQEQTPPNLAMISVALDLAHEPHLPLVVGGVRRRLEVGRLGGLHRQKGIARLGERLAALERPLETPVCAAEVEAVRQACKRSGVPTPRIFVAANAVAKYGAADLLSCVNWIRAGYGFPPIDAAALAALTGGGASEPATPATVPRQASSSSSASPSSQVDATAANASAARRRRRRRLLVGWRHGGRRHWRAGEGGATSAAAASGSERRRRRRRRRRERARAAASD